MDVADTEKRTTVNVVQISGNLTHDPELKWLGSGDRQFPIATLNVAVENGYGRWNRDTGKTEIDSGFYRVEVPGDHGVDVVDAARKGDRVHVIGSLSQFTGGKEGNERTHTQIRAEVVTVMQRGNRQPPPTQPVVVEPF